MRLTRLRLAAAAVLVCMVLLFGTPSGMAAAPRAAFTFDPKTPSVGDPVKFLDASSDPDQDIVQWRWDFGDGAAASTADSRHTYATAGNFTVTLTVTDGTNATDATSKNVTIKPAAAQPAQLPPGPFGLPSWLFWVMPLLVALILYGIAALTLLRGQKVIYNRVFFLFYALSATKSLIESTYWLSITAWPSPKLAAWLSVFDAVVGSFYIASFLWFVLVFPRPAFRWVQKGGRGGVTLLLALPFVLALFIGFQITNVFNVYVSFAALAALALLVYHAWETDSHEERQRIALLGVTFFLLVLVTIVVTLVGLLQTAAQAQGRSGAAATLASIRSLVGLVISPFLEIVGATVLMYAILKYQLLGVERLVKRATRSTLFALTIGVVFIIVSNTIQQLFQITFLKNVHFDFIIAGFVSTGVMYPVQKLTGKVANRLFPDADSTDPAVRRRRRMEIYEAQLRYALLDQQLKEKELAMLHALRDSLELRPDELRAVAKKFPSVPVEALLGSGRTAAPATPSR